MSPRLRMTTADYLAIAVSPALVMLLVGSLVFFLIEVTYVGQHQARLNYVFALFVFATVLIARISIELGSERAAMYSVPLGLAVFVVLLRFVEHPTALSPLVNLLLIAVVWWCAHKLTWDCTLIDDNQDASGEGLMQRVGVDDGDPPGAEPAPANNLLPDNPPRSFWQRLLAADRGPHTPGLWVLYFSLAALPIFGLGQWFIPAADTGSRRYTFLLLVVYVAAGLMLLVTTSFLGFRRYLRQRQVEMPLPMAATWVATGGVLAGVVLLLAMLLPRPQAEYALARPPWQVTSPDGLRPSRYGMGRDGVESQQAERQGSADPDSQAPPTATTDQPTDQPPVPGDGQQQSSGEQSGEQASDQQTDQSGESTGEPSSSDERAEASADQPSDQQSTDAQATSDTAAGDAAAERPDTQATDSQPGDTSADDTTGESRPLSGELMPEHSQRPDPVQAVQQVSRAVGGLAGLVKWLLYLLLAAVVGYLAWKHRHELLAAVRDILRDLRAWLTGLLGRDRDPIATAPEEATGVFRPRRRFCDFRNPFASGAYRQMTAEELVRYTFEAFEAWCAERGTPRSPDQTPQELVRLTTPASDPLRPPARLLARLYSEVAYGGGRVSDRDAHRLADLWRRLEATAPASTAP